MCLHKIKIKNCSGHVVALELEIRRKGESKMDFIISHSPVSSRQKRQQTDRQTDVICVLAFIFTGKRFREIIKPSEIAQCTHTTFTIPETVSTAQVETKEKKNP